MSEKPIIQRFLCYLLLVVFTFSFVPKTYLHEVLANHTDVIACDHPGAKAECVHPKGFRCDVNDLVVTAPYIFISHSSGFTPSVFTVAPTTPLYVFAMQQYFTGTEGRGPPSVGLA